MRRVLRGASACVCMLLVVGVSHGAAAENAPGWSVRLTANPTNFPPSTPASSGFPAYYFIATNTGGASVNGPATVSVELPAGVEPSQSSGEEPRALDLEHHTIGCKVHGTEVVCLDPGPIVPGAWIAVEVPVDVLAQSGEVLRAGGEISGGGASAASTLSTLVDAGQAPFSFLEGSAGIWGSTKGSDGLPFTRAGGHPYQVALQFGFPSKITPSGGLNAAGHVRDLAVEMPPGLIINPTATPKCSEAEFEGPGSCPEATQVGFVRTPLVVGERFAVQVPEALYNLDPPPGAAAAFGFIASNTPVHILGGLTPGNYRLAADTPDILAARLPILSAEAYLWGNPSDQSFDRVRKECGRSGVGSCPVPRSEVPFVTMPTACSPSTTLDAHASSWEEPERVVSRSAAFQDELGNPLPVTGCDAVPFTPELRATPTERRVDSPTGLDVQLRLPQSKSMSTLAEANLKEAKVTLPVGLVLNPSSAGGLAGCSSRQVGLDPTTGRADGAEPSCPDSSRIGSVKIDTPLLEGSVNGSVYVATPYDNPSQSLLGIYIVLDEPSRGILVKLFGQVEPDPQTGQLTTTVKGSPQVPFEELHLTFFGGPSAALRTPSTCGSHVTEGIFESWASEVPKASADAFGISEGSGEGSCPTESVRAPAKLSFAAGTENAAAGAFSPFVLSANRGDGTQEISSLETTLPPGLIGRLAGTAICGEQMLSAAKAASGQSEQTDPSCPANSRLGSVTATSGAGPTPIRVQGTAYLAGPYKGAPASVAFVVPAVAGPYDLGTVVTRAALYINPVTTQVRALSDPLPSVLHGIPLDIRGISLHLDRPDFTLNPTSCDEMAITGTATSVFDQTIPLTQRFQVGGCSGLPFKPKLSLELKGKTKRTSHPRLIANLTARAGDANIAKAQVKLPGAAFLDQGHIGTVCTRVQFAANQCPAGSVYGTVWATTPLLDYKLTGNVYLRSSTHQLPDLVAQLRGPATQPIEVELAGKTDSVKGALRNTFEAVPDAPVSKFHLELFGGGKRGLIILSAGLCKSPRAQVKLDGQNGKFFDTSPTVKTSCPKKHKAHNHRGKK